MVDPEFSWREIFETSPIPMSIIDPYGRQIAGNRAYADFLGYKLDELDQLDVGRLTIAEQREWTASYITRLVSGDIDKFTTDKRFVRADGTEVYGRLSTVPLRNEQGQCYALSGVIDPMVRRQRVDDDRLRRVLEFSQSTITILSEDGTVLETTGSHRPVHGYPVDFWEQRSIFDVVAPDDRDRVKAFGRALMANPGVEIQEDFLVRQADGSMATLLVHAVNLLHDPTVEGIIVSSLDVTEERRMLHELSNRSNTAESVAEAQTHLMATVSHELRNPLHAVQGLAELLASENLPPRAAALASTLAKQLQGLAGVTHDLLDTVRVDSGAVVLNLGPTDLHAVVSEIVDYGKAAVGDRPVEIVQVLAPTVPRWVSADGVRLRQILRNLVGNAVKFTKAGSITVIVQSGLYNAVTMTVSDTGAGIPADELDKVLQPFKTGSTAGEARGAGLGLSIVQRFVTAMGGALTVNSAVGHGTSFRVEIPLLPVEAPVANLKQGSEEKPSAHVLLVEDNIVNQQLARSQLDRLGMTVQIVGSGEEAIDVLRAVGRPKFDVVLMDYQLPGIDGVETTRQIRQLDDDVAALPVIGLTASASAADREAFISAGMDGFVSKPATLDDIRQAIAEALRLDGDELTLRRRPAPAEKPEPPKPVERAVDEAVIQRLCDEFGERGIVIGLTESFLREFPARVSSLRDALESKDQKTAGRSAHTLKSSARLLGASRLADMCQTIENGDFVDRSELDRIISATADEMQAWKERG